MGLLRGPYYCRNQREMWNYQSVTFQKKFSDSQRRYSTVEKEALALLLALRHFEVYLGANLFL